MAILPRHRYSSRHRSGSAKPRSPRARPSSSPPSAPASTGARCWPTLAEPAVTFMKIRTTPEHGFAGTRYSKKAWTTHMKQLLLLTIAGALFAAPQPPTFRLPSDAVPARYRLDLTLDPAKDTFSGVVTIDLKVRQATDV